MRLDSCCGECRDDIGRARIDVCGKRHAGWEQCAAVQRLGIEILGPRTDPPEHRTARCRLLEKRRGGGVFKFRLIENHCLVALFAIPDLAIGIHMERLVGNFAGRN